MTDTYDVEKASTQHVENEKLADEVIFDDAEDTPPTGFAKLLRRNPSMDFMRDVAAECEKDDLDPHEVKRVSDPVGK